MRRNYKDLHTVCCSAVHARMCAVCSTGSATQPDLTPTPACTTTTGPHHHPTNRFGVTMAVHQARVAHAQEYTTFIQARRTAAARKYLTQPEGGKDDVNMGMQPFRYSGGDL